MGDEVIQGNWMGVGREVEECSDVDGTESDCEGKEEGLH